ADDRQDAILQLAQKIVVQKDLAMTADRDGRQPVLLVELGNQLAGPGRSHIGAADQVGLAEAAEAAEPGDGEDALFLGAAPETLDPLEDLEVPPANLAGDRLQHLAAAQRLRRRRSA